jgi:general secretion pathway protein K
MRALPSLSRFSTSARRGSVIVVVLVTLLLASMMLMKFIENSAVELTLATRQADKVRLRADAYAALETALAVMAEIKAVDENLFSPEQGWDDPYGYAGESPRDGLQVSFSFTDESGKRSLPGMSFQDMVEFVQALGLSETDARRFSDGLYAWTTADHTPQDMEAEASRYERETLPHTPPKRSLRSWDELRSVRVAREYVYDPETGALTGFGQALRDNLSLYSFDSSNINALAPMLGAARGWDENQNTSIAAYRSGKGARAAGAPTWFRTVSDLTSVIGANADVEGLDAVAKLVRVDVTVREGAGSMRLSALVALDEGVSLPEAVSAEGAENSGGGAGGGGRNNNPGGGQGNGGEGGQGRPGGGNGQGRPGGNGQGRPGRGGQVAPGGGARAGMTLQQATPGRTTGGRANRPGGTTGETSGNGATSEERLDYPFTILEVIEIAGPEPVAAAIEAESDPQS